MKIITIITISETITTSITISLIMVIIMLSMIVVNKHELIRYELIIMINSV